MDEDAGEWEAVVDVRRGGALRRAGDLAIGVVGAVLGDPSAAGADVVVRRRDDHAVELFRIETSDEEEAAALVSEVRRDLDLLPIDELVGRWGPDRPTD